MAVDSVPPPNPALQSRPDIFVTPSAARPTPKPPRASFGEVLAAGASVAASGAQTALSALPGSPVSAPGIRQAQVMQASGTTLAEGPGATPVSTLGLNTGSGLSTGTSSLGTLGTSGTSGTDSSMSTVLQQSAALSMQYLELQQQEDAQQRSYEALSNIEKTRHDSAHNAIGNIGQ
jgi:hypothetical protein